LRTRFERARERLDGLAGHRAFRNPLDRLHHLEERLDEVDGRLRRTVAMRLERARANLGAGAARLGALSPLNVLARGDRPAQVPDGRVVEDVQLVRPGDMVRTRLARGELVCRVEATHPATEARP